jgi:hypothetical protein
VGVNAVIELKPVSEAPTPIFIGPTDLLDFTAFQAKPEQTWAFYSGSWRPTEIVCTAAPAGAVMGFDPVPLLHSWLTVRANYLCGANVNRVLISYRQAPHMAFPSGLAILNLNYGELLQTAFTEALKDAFRLAQQALLNFPAGIATHHQVAGLPAAIQVVEPVVDLPAASLEYVAREDVPAYRAFKELTAWLEMTDDGIAGIVGIGRTTVYAWARDGHEPRPATVRRLYQMHALIGAVYLRLGRSTMRQWLDASDPSPRQLLAEHRIDELNRLARPVLFGRGREPELGLGASIDESRPEIEPNRPDHPDRLTLSERRPRRVNLGSD